MHSEVFYGFASRAAEKPSRVIRCVHPSLDHQKGEVMAGGFRKKSQLYTLKWAEGQELAGLEVVTKGLTIDRLNSILPLAESLQDTGRSLPDKMAEADKLFRSFARSLVSWNLEDEDGNPVPATYEGVADQDFDFALKLILVWVDSVAGVDIPLPPSSASGASALEGSLPMAPLSPSPGS